MVLKAEKSNIKGSITIPGSKSHTIRALFIASLAKGSSTIINPLISQDTLSALECCRAFGADIKRYGDRITVVGTSGKPRTPENIIDVGNSGTTLRFAAAAAGLCDGWTVLTGDEQIRARPLSQLMEALNNLGAEAFATRKNGMAPVVVKGGLCGGKTDLDAVSSQYLSALLIAMPLIKGESEINILRLNEVPYVDMTLKWLEDQSVDWINDNYEVFKNSGGYSYKSFDACIPGDFSSATFFSVMAAVSKGEILMSNLDINDTQGDKRVLEILESMGAKVSAYSSAISVKGLNLTGREIDMNDIPDALPALAVAGCFAEGETRLLNVPQARLKETDRIKAMCSELGKMGADIYELDDGLVIRKSVLSGGSLNGYGDHRIVMALAVAGMAAKGETLIDTAEAVNVTFPDFADLAVKCGGRVEFKD